MTKDLHNRLTRLESVLGVVEGPAIEDLPKLSAEEFDAALALAAAEQAGPPGGKVKTMPSMVPQAMAEAMEQARALKQAALDLGRTRLGFQRDPARYLDAALPEMFPEPHSPAVAAMVEALRANKLPFITYLLTAVIDGRMAPDGWRPS